MRIQRMRLIAGFSLPEKRKTNTFNSKESRAFHRLTDGPRNRQISALFHFLGELLLLLLLSTLSALIGESGRLCGCVDPVSVPLRSSSTKKIMTKITGICITGLNEGAINRSSIQYSFLVHSFILSATSESRSFFLQRHNGPAEADEVRDTKCAPPDDH
jgi:hypothetical protein